MVLQQNNVINNFCTPTINVHKISTLDIKSLVQLHTTSIHSLICCANTSFAFTSFKLTYVAGYTWILFKILN